MSLLMDEDIKRWTAKRKSALVLEIIQGTKQEEWQGPRNTSARKHPSLEQVFT